MEFIVNLVDDQKLVEFDNLDDQKDSSGGLKISVTLMKKNLTMEAIMGWIMGHWRRRVKMILKSTSNYEK